MEQQITVQRKKLIFIVSIGLMAALVFLGNYLQIKIPVALGDVTRIHLGNSMCLLAGLLFGPMTGGLASGIGAGLFDLLGPMYIMSAPYTFLSKFAMGFLAGYLARQAFPEGKTRLPRLIGAAVCGQLAYIVLYLFKSYVSLRLVGNAPAVALAAVLPKLLTSSVNAAAAVVIAVPLTLALRKALKQTGFSALLAKPAENRKISPAALIIGIAVAVVALFLFLYLAL